MCILEVWALGILIPSDGDAYSVPNFVSFAASIAELSHGEKSGTQPLTHSLNHPSAYLMPR